MRVAYLTDRLSLRGGAGAHLLQVMRWAAASGFEVRLGAGWVDRGVELPEGVRALRVRALAGHSGGGTAGERLGELLAWADVVHVQNVMRPAVLSRIVGARPTVVTVQDHRVFCPGPGRTLPDGSPCREPMGPVCAACLPDPTHRSRMLELTAARLGAVRRAWRVVALSSYMARELEAAGVDGVRVVPPWVEPGPAKRAAGETILLGGRLVRHKDPLTALAAWELAGRPLPLRVAGRGPLEARLAGAERLGWLRTKELAVELRRARMLLFPARWQEPFGILGVEALAQGTPVVVAAAGGTGDWSDAGCIRVAPGDPAAMAEAIRRLAGEPEPALELGERGRRLVRRRFSRRAVEPRLAALYT